MSFFLQNPAFLGLLAIAGLPLLVHLLSRAKPPEYRFSNIAFLRKAIAQTSRFKKPKDWILLLLRTLAVLALVAAFLLPILLSENAPLPGEKRSLVIVVDRSASMAAREDAASRFDAATARAAEILSDIRPDLANIVWIDSAPTAVFPEPAPNLGFLGDELARATPRPEPGAIDAAIELALRQLSDAPGRREIYVISDFQEIAWKNFSPTLPKGVRLEMSSVAKSDLPNLAVSSLVTIPSAPVAGQQVVAQCRVVNFSNEPRRVSLTVDAGGSRQSQDLSLPANGEAEAAFTVRVPNPGLLPFTAEIDADSFPGDDRRHAVIRVRESIRLAVAAPENHPVTETLARVAASIPWLELIPAADLERLPPCEILCLPEWNGTNPEKLRDLAKTTALLVYPSPGFALAPLLGGGDAQMPALQTDPTGWEASPDPEHPAFRLFSQGQFGNPLAGKFRERTAFPKDLPATVIASFSDNIPAMMMANNLPILVSSLSLDPAKSTWSTEAPFLPAIAEILLHLAPSASAASFAALPGDTLAWTNPATETAINPVLESPSSEAIPLESTAATYRATAPAVPGIYRWLISGQPVQLTAVNFPESESDLAPMESPPSAGSDSSPSVLAGNPAFEQGLNLWPYLVALGLLFLLLEPLAGRFIAPTNTR